MTPSKGLWHCFGCNKGGDALSWVQEREGLSFPAATLATDRKYTAATAARPASAGAGPGSRAAPEA